MYAVINDEAVLAEALKLARGSYQASILTGAEALSGATLRGRAKDYSSRYKASAQNLLARCRAAGLAVREEIGSHGKRLVIVG